MENVIVMQAGEVSTVLIIRESVTLCVTAVPDQMKQTVHLVSNMLAVMLKDIVCVTQAGLEKTVKRMKVIAGMSVPFSEDPMTAKRDQSSVNDV
jgi:predicted membrane GTPase involved in stress response